MVKSSSFQAGMQHLDEECYKSNVELTFLSNTTEPPLSRSQIANKTEEPNFGGNLTVLALGRTFIFATFLFFIIFSARTGSEPETGNPIVSSLLCGVDARPKIAVGAGRVREL